MEGRKENKYNLSGICPQCGKLLKLELVVATELVEEGTTTETEAKEDDSKGKTEGAGGDPAESGPVRPADEAAGPSEPGQDPPANDSKHGKRAKKTGGR